MHAAGVDTKNLVQDERTPEVKIYQRKAKIFNEIG
jgi:hypothetical protein